MTFRSHFLSLDATQRAAFADQAKTTVGYLMQVAYGNKELELGLADVLVAVAQGALTLDDIPLTARAAMQREIRGGSGAGKHLPPALMGDPGQQVEPTEAGHAG